MTTGFRDEGVKADAFAELRRELRAFHPDDGHASNQMRKEQLLLRTKHMEQFAAEHPEADALDFRQEIYRLERENFNSDTAEALLRSFAALGLQLLQLNCISSQDLEDATVHPENHQDLVVRVCGFSAKFVSLCPEWQEEIINRRKY